MSNNIQLVTSDHYGDINYESVGVVDFGRLLKLDIDDYFAWSDKYHYRTYFKSCIIKRLHLFEDDQLDSYEIFVPIDDINVDWNPEYWLKKNGMKKRKIKLPIRFSRKKSEIWKKELNSLYDSLEKK